MSFDASHLFQCIWISLKDIYFLVQNKVINSAQFQLKLPTGAELSSIKVHMFERLRFL